MCPRPPLPPRGTHSAVRSSCLIEGDIIYRGGLMAGAPVAALPPTVVYVFLVDYCVSGLAAGVTKGQEPEPAHRNQPSHGRRASAHARTPGPRP